MCFACKAALISATPAEGTTAWQRFQSSKQLTEAGFCNICQQWLLQPCTDCCKGCAPRRVHIQSHTSRAALWQSQSRRGGDSLAAFAAVAACGWHALPALHLWYALSRQRTGATPTYTNVLSCQFDHIFGQSSFVTICRQETCDKGMAKVCILHQSHQL